MDLNFSRLISNEFYMFARYCTYLGINIKFIKYISISSILWPDLLYPRPMGKVAEILTTKSLKVAWQRFIGSSRSTPRSEKALASSPWVSNSEAIVIQKMHSSYPVLSSLYVVSMWRIFRSEYVSIASLLFSSVCSDFQGAPDFGKCAKHSWNLKLLTLVSFSLRI